MRRPSFVKQRRRLDRNATFQRRSGSVNTMNEPVEGDWLETFSTRCATYPAPGFERLEGGQNISTSPMMIEVRSDSRSLAILPSDRVIVDNVTYNIVAPVEQPERGANIRIIAAVDL